MSDGNVAFASSVDTRSRLSREADKALVFVIEDDAFSLRNVVVGLRNRYQCVDALKLWHSGKFESDEAPVAAIIDLGLPDEFDVVSMIGSLAAQYPRLPVIIMSGKDDKTLDVVARLARLHEFPVAGVLKKPIRVSDLLNALEGARVELRQSAPGLSEKVPVVPIQAGEIFAGIESDQFVVHYQPQICMAKGEVVGLEALCRWNKPGRGMIGPNEFIAPVESDPVLAVDFTLYIAEKTFNDFARLSARTKFCGRVSINVPLLSFAAEGFVEALSRRLDASGVPPERITVELTEHGFGGDHRDIMANLARMRIRDFRLSIDDFGTGNSSFHKLKELGFDELKIDKSFIKDVHWNVKSQSIVRYLVGLARDMNLTVVAEGVEELESVRYLMKFCAPIVQGYYFCRPLTLEDTIAFLAKSSFLSNVDS